jgi:hypothetical protein
MGICSYAPQQHANDDFSENISSKCMLQQHSAHLKFKAYGELDLDALNLLIWHTVLHIDLLHVYATLKLNGDRTMALNRMSNGKRWPSLQKKKLLLGKHMHTFASSLNFIMHRREWKQDIAQYIKGKHKTKEDGYSPPSMPMVECLGERPK